MKTHTYIFKHLFLFCLLALAVASVSQPAYDRISSKESILTKLSTKRNEERRNKQKSKVSVIQLPQIEKGKSAAVKKK